MSTKEYEDIKELKERVKRLEDHNVEQDLRRLSDYGELKDLILEAVKLGNKEVIEKIETLDKKFTNEIDTLKTRIQVLESKDGEKAKLIIKSILASTLGWFVLGVLNNLPMIFKK